jgi:hypothetical protein
VYLYRNEHVAFNDLKSSDDAHNAFRRFVRLYNEGQLEEAYYDPSGAMPADAVNEIRTTQHQWKFSGGAGGGEGASGVGAATTDELRRLQQGVRQQTEYRGDNK